VTAVIMGCIGSCQFDFKRVIAYSTCSQLGLMLSGFAFYCVSVSFFHLFVHAFFKALLFLGAGLVIHCVKGEQDLRRFGLFARFFPIVYICFCIGIFALIGFPFFSGFYSKHLLLDVGSV
jgi:NADH:ubiquinone oxidoreductase subunit 5 (subunit L)/multisubunit Na+/H+ antiporter MnhA subunit